MIDVAPVYLPGLTPDGLNPRMVLLGYRAVGYNKRLMVSEFSFATTIAGAIIGLLFKLRPKGINVEEN